MGSGNISLLVLRVLVLIVALGVTGLGAWSMYIVHDMNERGTTILEAAQLESQSMNQYWFDYFTNISAGVVRMWISIAAAAFASLAGLVLVTATISHRMRMPSSILIPLECLSMCAMATAFGTALSFTYSLDVFSKRRLDAVDSKDLMMFGMIVDISRGYAVSACAGWFIAFCACITAAAGACSRARAKESCSFEPTASALGMGYGHVAIVPPETSSRVPSIYDPQLPLYKVNEKKGFTETDVELGRVDSAVSEEGRALLAPEKENTMELEKPEKARHVRPTKPWSVISGRDDEAHTL